MKKIYYDDLLPLKHELTKIYEDDPHNHDEAYRTMLMFVLHKGGFTESGIPIIQFDQCFEAFLEANQTIAELFEKNIAHMG